MEILQMLGTGLLTMLKPENLIFLLIGVIVGIVLGAIPGLSATMAIALIIPFTYYMTLPQSISMCLGAFNGGCFGGSVSAILLSTPGTTAASATVLDGYPLARKGQSMKAIKTALISSMCGCFFATVCLIVIAQPIAKVALKIGPPEYFIIMIIALTIIGSAAGDDMLKGLLGGVIGLILGTIGLDPMEGSSRLTFGNLKLASGIDLVVMLIGLLALSAIIAQIENPSYVSEASILPPPKTPEDEKLSKAEVKRIFPVILQSSVIGTVIGALPGLGSTLAAWLGYDMAKRRSKHPELFGTGIIEGVAGPEAANNAVCGSNMIPLLTLGIPGDTTAALLVGAFMLKGITPGPLIFRTNAQDVYSIYLGVILANLLMVVVAFLFLRVFKKVSSLKPSVVIPCVCMFCMIGVFALYSSLTDMIIMLIFTIVGYIMIKFKFPVACTLVGFILSKMVEKYFRMSLVLGTTGYRIFFRGPLDWILWIIAGISITAIIVGKVRKIKQNKAPSDQG